MTDKEILALFFDRRQEALGEVREQYGGKLHRLAENILNNRQDAEECVSDALLTAWNSIPPQRPLPLLPWLYATVRNIALARWRHDRARKRGGSAFSLAYEELDEVLSAGEGPEEALDAKELTELLNRFLACLGSRDRALFLGRYWYGESYRAMAERLGMTENNCMVRVARIRKKLKSFLIGKGVLGDG